MGLLNKVAALVIVLLLLRIHPYKACRILEDKGGVRKSGGGFLLGSLQKGSDTPPGHSGCTNVPGNPGPSCPPVQEMNFAGHARARASAYQPPAVARGMTSNK
ncbi:hypothetical protein CKAN_01847300 [Cinnamomum micranthum f. kanehirae]|uniref:Secreted protein n=1 Tax=Cinnamomum micranthum f. kanehirae TaxID=337451 RepID=A0A443PF83_9MAGN|nr:hypothetical protein CKAN_01847300 [Cinnamomum micranthum f. kanehirae]